MLFLNFNEYILEICMALDVLHQMLIYAEALLIAKHSVGAKETAHFI